MHTIFAELPFRWVYHVWVNVPLLSQICLFVSLLLILRFVFTVVAIPWGTLLVCVLVFYPCRPTDVPICSLSVHQRPQRTDPFLDYLSHILRQLGGNQQAACNPIH